MFPNILMFPLILLTSDFRNFIIFIKFSKNILELPLKIKLFCKLYIKNVAIHTMKPLSYIAQNVLSWGRLKNY